MLICKRILTLTLTLTLYLGGFSAYSQEKFSDNLWVTANYQYGFMLPEYSFVSEAVDAPVHSLDLSFYKSSNGKDAFDKLYNYPDRGIGIYYTSLGSRDVFGQAIAANYFFRINIIDRKRFRLFNRMGIGVGYLTKTHSFENTPENKNVAIGSHFNIHYNCRVGMLYNISKRFNANLGVSFDHFSNANTSEPNIGLNILTAYTGVSYLLGDFIERTDFEVPPHERKWSFETFLSFGGKHTRSFSNKYYATASTSTQATFEWFRGFHVGTGIDLFFDNSIQDQYEEKGLEFNRSKSFQSGIHFSQVIVFRKFRFILQEGFYLGLREPINNKVMYNRGILKYCITDQWSVRLAMKSHLHILDYPEIGIGFKWK